MKLFDFTSGKKGREIAEIKVANSLGGWYVEKNGKSYKVELANNPAHADETWSWHSRATYYDAMTGAQYAGGDVPILPEDFGVDAICFCTGEIFHTWYPGHPDAESSWEWAVIGSADWNRQACKRGILKATAQK